MAACRSFVNSAYPPLRVLLPLVVVWLAVAGCVEQRPTASPRTQAVELGGRRFVLELAIGPKQTYRGLSDRDYIAPDGGMLFVFPDHEVGVKRFVMRRCLVPIDIVFLDTQGRIVAMHAMEVEPYDTPDHKLKQYSSVYPSQFVIEVAGGTLEQLPVKLGDLVDLPRDELKALAPQDD